MNDSKLDIPEELREATTEEINARYAKEYADNSELLKTKLLEFSEKTDDLLGIAISAVYKDGHTERSWAVHPSAGIILLAGITELQHAFMLTGLTGKIVDIIHQVLVKEKILPLESKN